MFKPNDKVIMVVKFENPTHYLKIFTVKSLYKDNKAFVAEGSSAYTFGVKDFILLTNISRLLYV